MSIVPCSEKCLVEVDAGQFQQAIMNLATNARDAMPSGGDLTIRTQVVDPGADFIRTHPSVSAGRHVAVDVRDTGTGMDAQTRTRIFDPFFTTKEVGKGTGLGLSMVYGFVQQSGGAIDVESEPGRGSTFRLYFPLVEAAAPSAAAPPGEVLPHGAETVVVVEDEAVVRRFVVISLESLGYKVLKFGDAREFFLPAPFDPAAVHPRMAK